MTGAIQAVRGMNDLLPEESAAWRQVEAVLRATLTEFGYQEIRLPLVEKTGLFSRAIGEVTDVVEKEMYTFEDRSGDSLSLRPEGTAGCVRACLEHNLIYNQERRLWYMGPMFRHERPQKGRCRQFHQTGVEVFGLSGPDIDAEIIALSAAIWDKLGLAGALKLQLNSLGSASERRTYRGELVRFLEARLEELDEDSRRRVRTNPLRVLDSKDPGVGEVLKAAPRLRDFFGEETRAHFAGLTALLDALGIPYELNDRLVRGLDYYNLTVFEWVTDALGAQGTVCGGGRYDGLVEQLGGAPSPAVGFGLGMERLMLLLGTLNKLKPLSGPQVYIAGAGEGAAAYQARLARLLRAALPGTAVFNHCGGGRFKKQLAQADRLGARVALIAGSDEIAANSVTIKDLRDSGAQLTCALDEAPSLVNRLLNK